MRNTAFVSILLLSVIPACQVADKSDFNEQLKQAQQGDAKAQYQLGLCYDKGEGVTKDTSEAVKWYRKAAEQGYAEAQVLLGACYTTGEGVAENSAEAVKWWRKAAEQWHAVAQFGLVLCQP